MSDSPVRSAIAFRLQIEGFDIVCYETACGLLAEAGKSVHCIVIDAELNRRDPVQALGALRRGGIQAFSVILATNPSQRQRLGIARAGALLIEKPLLTDILAATICHLRGQPAPEECP